MMRYGGIRILVLASVLVLGSAISSWAWARVGFRGPGVGVYLGPGPWWYDPYGPNYYDPYYSPYYGPAPYEPEYQYVPDYPPAVSQDQGALAESPETADSGRRDLRFLHEQISRARSRIEFEYDDGDISRAEHDAEIDRLIRLKREAKAEAKVNSGYLTGDQEQQLLQQLRSGASPAEPSSGQSVNAAPATSADMNRLNGEFVRVHDLLDKKLADGDITKPQHDRMSSYLARIEQQVKMDAAANDGTVTPDQEKTVLQQLQRVTSSLSNNLVNP